MEQFKNPDESHAHSLKILNLLYEYDEFLDSLQVVADMGCGAGLDTEWWATLHDRDEPPKPHDYICYAVDKDINQIENRVLENKNVVKVPGDFEKPILSRKVDLMWSHDSFQYAVNPLNTLKIWNQQMSVNGMLLLTIPQHQGHLYNRLVTRSHNGCYFNHTPVSLLYMLAVNGFDCRDSFFYKETNDPYMTAVVYKSDIEPMDPASTSWYDLSEKRLVNDSVVESLNKNGYVKQEDLLFTWLDKDWRFVKD